MLERIRKEVVCLICDTREGCQIVGQPDAQFYCGHILAKADQILSIEVYKDKTGKVHTLRDLIEKGVTVADDQRLPLSGPYSLREAKLVRGARNQMLTPDSKGEVFMKVIPNPARTKELER